MKTKFLIMAVKDSRKKVLDIFDVESQAREMLPQYKEKDTKSLYIKQISVY